MWLFPPHFFPSFSSSTYIISFELFLRYIIYTFKLINSVNPFQIHSFLLIIKVFYISLNFFSSFRYTERSRNIMKNKYYEMNVRTKLENELTVTLDTLWEFYTHFANDMRCSSVGSIHVCVKHIIYFRVGRCYESL